MAKYTVQVRTVLGQCWLDKNPGKTVDDLDMVSPKQLCDTVWDSVFDFPFPMFPGMTSQELCSQILMFYFMREIGLETVALWKHYLQVRMTGIMPYYIKLAESEISKAEALQNRNITEKVNRKGDEAETKKNTVVSNRTGKEEESDEDIQTVDNRTAASENTSGSSTQKTDNRQMYADTPQDGLTPVIEGNYLTNATVNDDQTVVNSSGDSSSNGTLNGESVKNANRHRQDEDNANTVADDDRQKGYEENVLRETSGFDGDLVDTVVRYREAILQIPLMIIRDLADLFIGILV